MSPCVGQCLSAMLPVRPPVRSRKTAEPELGTGSASIVPMEVEGGDFVNQVDYQDIVES